MNSTWNKDEEIEKSINEFKKTITKDPFKQYLDKNIAENLEDKDKQILFCADALYQGYLDACRTFKGQEKINKIKVENEKPVGTENNKLWSIADDIYKYLCDGNVDEFDEQHHNWCKCFMEYQGMKYGQAQKIINMAFKYMYCLLYEVDKVDKDVFKKCHMPLDSFSLEWLRRRDNNFPIKVDAWSKLNYEEYELCRDRIKNLLKDKEDPQITPLQADIIVWEKMKIILAAEEFLHTIDNQITYKVLKGEDNDQEIEYGLRDIINIQKKRFGRVKKHIELLSEKQ